MQRGEQTVGDGMRRHLITLERERQNLEESAKLCQLLQARTEPLSDLDAQTVLEEMEKLEQTGTTFQNKQRNDERIRYVAPVIIAAAMIGLLLGLIGLMVWGVCTEPETAPPLALLLVLIAMPVLLIGGIMFALIQRIVEIKKGEIDDAKKY